MYHYVTAFMDGSVEVAVTEWTSQKIPNEIPNIQPPLFPSLTFRNWDQWKQHLYNRLLQPLRNQLLDTDSNVLPPEQAILEDNLKLLEFEYIRPDPLIM